nr:hypothetical protein [Tanacetum cinerariifolium]GEZ51799.1 hypothetical protein [Tanacetum cinerariifolium]
MLLKFQPRSKNDPGRLVAAPELLTKSVSNFGTAVGEAAVVLKTPGSGISILLAVGTPSTGSENLYCQWELSHCSGNALCILFLTEIVENVKKN